VALPTLRPLPGTLLAVTVLGELGALGLSWGLEPAYDTLFSALVAVLTVGVGALILSRHPSHVIGWLLCVLGLANALAADLPQGWGLRAAAEGWAWGPAAEWLGLWTFLLLGVVWVLIFLLFPSGHLPNRRWSTVVWLDVAGTAILAAGWALDPDTGRYFAGGRNPYAVPGLPTDALFWGGLVTIAVAMVTALAAVVGRLRRSHGVERQQMKWFALSSGFVVAALPTGAALWNFTPLVHPLPLIALTVWPIAIGVAILRYRLYDVDLVISRAFTGAVLTVVLALVYVGSTLVIGAFAGFGSPWATAVSTLLAATAFKLLHQRVQRRVDSAFRPMHHAALSRVGEFIDALRADQVEPEQVVEALRSALGDPLLELRFVLYADEPPVDERGRPVADHLDGGRESYVVERGGITLGQIVWLPRTEEQRRLLPSVVAAAGLAIEMARLRVELRHRLDEVEASRARIVTVADEERRRIERDLHDGAQQRLVSIGLALRHAQHQLGPAEAAASRTLDDAIAQITQAIDELRELAQGLHPALEAGLRPALHELATRAPLPVDVVATAERFPSDVETAAYFVACEGLTNAVKHARAQRVVLRVARENGRCVVSVTDNGVGGARPHNGSGLTGLSDRVAARGGSLRIDSTTGHGTTLTVEFPCAS